MQVSVETLNDLERRVTVQLPAEQVTREIQDRLVSMSRRLKVDGFRPGKVPLKVIRRMYGDQARYEVVSELMEHSLREALVQEKLNPLGGPRLEPKMLEEGQDLEYCATFEVMPEFELSGFENIKVERPVAEVTDQDVDHMIETLRQQRVIWNAVERSACIGDRVRFDFEGASDGQGFAGGKGENADIVLGKGTMLKDFEDRLVGLSAGAETGFDLTFPEDYQAKEVAGKVAHFQIKLHRVEEAHLPEIDDAFAESFDVKEGGVAALRQSLRENMERELRQGINAAVKHQVLQGLLAANAIPLPRVLINSEIEQLARQLRLPPGADDERTQQLKTYVFEADARRRVALGLLISRLATAQDIKVDDQRVRNHLHSVAATYQEPTEVVRWYEQTPQALDSIRALVIEEQVVDWLLERAQVTEKTSTFAEIMTPNKASALNPVDQESAE
ncbi:MAG: trigger factor [Candidatus Competibacteraceae bacterium]|uniref:Trigger factor n=1 Tax=Candidatus Contendobacter odensis Run_B_J11 TaxID=1400861 RepID=A0A7U7G9K4_9GAMM|nr:trigger factor [Candidatus Contendobacter odensis]MBK8537441.1 trigger factor [Candidatus Competibacteraceae bacterium]MBK8751784.1 trigger factor [Candidatus Competibacteraceae bacterium]CDH44380.1 peptidyl-prolyl cis/trans isomerase (trigger factor) [Candidatus Contendobacter odensis Run_B_J11]